MLAAHLLRRCASGVGAEATGRAVAAAQVWKEAVFACGSVLSVVNVLEL